MKIEKIEKSKARVDLFIFLFIILWIALRVLHHMDFEQMEFALHFVRLFLIIGGVFLMVQYLYFNKKLTDEFEQMNKHKAYKFSWVFTLLSVILLYIISEKTGLKAEFAIELILWIGYLSYFAAFKFLDAGLDARISEKYKKIIGAIALFLTSLIIGMNLGYAMPDLSYDQYNQHKLFYIGISLFLIIGATLFLLRFVRMIKDNESSDKQKGER